MLADTPGIHDHHGLAAKHILHAARPQLVRVETHTCSGPTSPAIPANPSPNKSGATPWTTLQGHTQLFTHSDTQKYTIQTAQFNLRAHS